MSIRKHLSNLKHAEAVSDQFLHITAYENRMSDTARSFMGTSLSDRYYFGGGDGERVIDWDPFTTLGQPHVENIINAAEKEVIRMVGGEIVNLSSLSGVHAMMCAILVATNPGDAVMIIHHDDGGHFSTPVILERSGRRIELAVFDIKKMEFNVPETAKIFKEKGCKALYLDNSYPVNAINLKAIRRAIGEGAVIIYDASHTIGLIMGGVYQNPFYEGADIICANTHKTLPGPHKGMIIFKDRKYGTRLNDTINNGLFSTSHTHHLLALSISILEMGQFGAEYATQTVANANMLAGELVRLGQDVRTIGNTYTYTHQVHLYLPSDQRPRDIYASLIKNMISTNFDNRLGGRVFARLGTQELTRRGMKEDDMKTIADILHDSLNGRDVRKRVQNINQKFSTVEYSFDEII